MRDRLVRRLRERHAPLIGLILLGLATCTAIAAVAQATFRPAG